MPFLPIDVAQRRCRGQDRRSLARLFLSSIGGLVWPLPVHQALGHTESIRQCSREVKQMRALCVQHQNKLSTRFKARSTAATGSHCNHGEGAWHVTLPRYFGEARYRQEDEELGKAVSEFVTTVQAAETAGDWQDYYNALVEADADKLKIFGDIFSDMTSEDQGDPTGLEAACPVANSTMVCADAPCTLR